MFFASIGLVWLIIVRLPVDYLVSEHSILKRKFADKRVLRGILVVIKNVLGLLLVGAGLVMLITPGQGILSLLIGLSMLDIPGKQTLVNRILGNRRVIRTINRIRAQASRQPLELPPQRN